VDFTELASGLSALCSGSREEKARSAFALYDVDDSGTIDLDEMTAVRWKMFSLSLFLPLVSDFSLSLSVFRSLCVSLKSSSSHTPHTFCFCVLTPIPAQYLSSVFTVTYETVPGTKAAMGGVEASQLARLTAEKAFQEGDIDGDGTLSWPEFALWYSGQEDEGATMNDAEREV
jgi:hypothetical protein